MNTVSGARHVVAAAILRQDGSVLLCHRSPDRAWYPATWDLPGGHVEAGEQPSHALVRELEEELGILADLDAEPFADVSGADYRMYVWLVDLWSGEPSNRAPAEHDALAWFTAEESRQLRLSDENLLPLIEAALGQDD